MREGEGGEREGGREGGGEGRAAGRCKRKRREEETHLERGGCGGIDRRLQRNERLQQQQRQPRHFGGSEGRRARGKPPPQLSDLAERLGV